MLNKVVKGSVKDKACGQKVGLDTPKIVNANIKVSHLAGWGCGQNSGLLDQPKTSPEFQWAHTAQRKLNPCLVIPAYVVVQNFHKSLKAHTSP